ELDRKNEPVVARITRNRTPRRAENLNCMSSLRPKANRLRTTHSRHNQQSLRNQSSSGALAVRFTFPICRVGFPKTRKLETLLTIDHVLGVVKRQHFSTGGPFDSIVTTSSPRSQTDGQSEWRSEPEVGAKRNSTGPTPPFAANAPPHRAARTAPCAS